MAILCWAAKNSLRGTIKQVIVFCSFKILIQFSPLYSLKIERVKSSAIVKKTLGLSLSGKLKSIQYKSNLKNVQILIHHPRRDGHYIISRATVCFMLPLEYFKPVHVFFGSGASPNVQRKDDLWTPLFVAAMLGRTQVANMLLQVSFLQEIK
jgi:hypothetical protein